MGLGLGMNREPGSGQEGGERRGALLGEMRGTARVSGRMKRLS